MNGSGGRMETIASDQAPTRLTNDTAPIVHGRPCYLGQVRGNHYDSNPVRL